MLVKCAARNANCFTYQTDATNNSRQLQRADDFLISHFFWRTEIWKQANSLGEQFVRPFYTDRTLKIKVKLPRISTMIDLFINRRKFPTQVDYIAS